MKNLIFLFVLFVFTISISAQKEIVPAKVKDAFAKLYPNAKSVKWSMESKTEYEAEFKNDNRAASVNFNKTGKLIETEIDIAKNELPSGVEKYISENFAGWTINEMSKVIDAKSTIAFELQIKKDGTKKDLVFDKDGELRKVEK